MITVSKIDDREPPLAAVDTLRISWEQIKKDQRGEAPDYDRDPRWFHTRDRDSDHVGEHGSACGSGTQACRTLK